MAIEHLSDKELDDYEQRGLSALNDDALSRLDLDEGYGIPEGPKKEEPVKGRGVLGEMSAGFYGRPPAEEATGTERVANIVGDIGLPVAIAAPFSAAPPVAAAVGAGVRGVQLGVRQLASEVGQIVSPGSERLAEKPKEGLTGGLEPVIDVAGTSASQLFGDVVAGPLVGKGLSKVEEGAKALGGKIAKAASPYVEELLNQFPNSKALLTAEGRKASIAKGVKQAAESMEWLDLQRQAINKKLGFRESFLGPRKIDYFSNFGKAAIKDIDTLGKAEKAPLIEAKNEIALRVKDIAETKEPELMLKAQEVRQDLMGRVTLPDDSAVLRILDKYTGLGGRIAGTGAQDRAAFGKNVLNPKQLKDTVSVAEMMEDFARLGEESQNLHRQGIYPTKQSNALNTFKEAIADRIQARIEDSKQTIVAKAWKENRAGWSKWYDKWESNTVTKLRKMDPDKVFDHIVSGEFSAGEAKQVLHPNTWQTIKQAKVADILGEVRAAQDPVKELGSKYSKGYLEAVFDPQEVKYLNDIVKLGKYGSEIDEAINNLMAGRLKALSAGGRADDALGAADIPRRAEEIAVSKAGMFQTYAGNTMLAGAAINEAVGAAFGVKIPRPYMLLLAGVGLGPKALANVYLKGGPVASKALAGTFKALGEGNKAAINASVKNLLKVKADIEKPKVGLGKLESLRAKTEQEAQPVSDRTDVPKSRDLEQYTPRELSDFGFGGPPGAGKRPTPKQEDPTEDIENLFQD